MFTYQKDGLLPVHVETPDGFGIETQHIIDSLSGALEEATRADARWQALTGRNETSIMRGPIRWDNLVGEESSSEAHIEDGRGVGWQRPRYLSDEQ